MIPVLGGGHDAAAASSGSSTSGGSATSDSTGSVAVARSVRCRSRAARRALPAPAL